MINTRTNNSDSGTLKREFKLYRQTIGLHCKMKTFSPLVKCEINEIENNIPTILKRKWKHMKLHFTANIAITKPSLDIINSRRS